jgi:NADPH2:quinone reductase
MRAVQAVEHGGYEALRLVDIPRPHPRSGQALVRITSAGVTPLDRNVLAGVLPRAKPPPIVLGNEGAGVVVEDPMKRFAAGADNKYVHVGWGDSRSGFTQVWYGRIPLPTFEGQGN